MFHFSELVFDCFEEQRSTEYKFCFADVSAKGSDDAPFCQGPVAVASLLYNGGLHSWAVAHRNQVTEWLDVDPSWCFSCLLLHNKPPQNGAT